MTEAAFSPKALEVLQSVRGLEWFCNNVGYLRVVQTQGRWWWKRQVTACPICAALNLATRTLRYTLWPADAYEELGLTARDLDNIVCATDNPSHPLRPALCAAIGFQP